MECPFNCMRHEDIQPSPSDSSSLRGHVVIHLSIPRRAVAENCRDRVAMLASALSPFFHPSLASPTNRHQAQRGYAERETAYMARMTRGCSLDLCGLAVATLPAHITKHPVCLCFFLLFSHTLFPFSLFHTPTLPPPLPSTIPCPSWLITAMAQECASNAAPCAH